MVIFFYFLNFFCIYFCESYSTLNDGSKFYWEWIDGSNICNDPGYFAELGIKHPDNRPPSRMDTAMWFDNEGLIYHFCGASYDSKTNVYNDMWKVNPNDFNWAWMGGSSTPNIFLEVNKWPGARVGVGMWYENGASYDNSESIYFFGGKGFGLNNIRGYLNDLWKFDIHHDNWTHIGGSLIEEGSCYQAGLGVISSLNWPCPRYFPLMWNIGRSIYMFGGRGAVGPMADLWQFNSDTLIWTWIGGPTGQGDLYYYESKNIGVPDSKNWPKSRHAAGNYGVVFGNDCFMFGGYSALFSFNNDLWSWNKITNSWTFYGNDSSNGVWNGYNQPGWPSIRSGHHLWGDSHGKFWIFGGKGFDKLGLACNLNDLWYFDTKTLDFIWAGGCNVDTRRGIYFSSNPWPGGRQEASWLWPSIEKDVIYMRGGYGKDCCNDFIGELSDFWRWKIVYKEEEISEKENYYYIVISLACVYGVIFFLLPIYKFGRSDMNLQYFYLVTGIFSPFVFLTNLLFSLESLPTVYPIIILSISICINLIVLICVFPSNKDIQHDMGLKLLYFIPGILHFGFIRIFHSTFTKNYNYPLENTPKIYTFAFIASDFPFIIFNIISLALYNASLSITHLIYLIFPSISICTWIVNPIYIGSIIKVKYYTPNTGQKNLENQYTSGSSLSNIDLPELGEKK